LANVSSDVVISGLFFRKETRGTRAVSDSTLHEDRCQQVAGNSSVAISTSNTWEKVQGLGGKNTGLKLLFSRY